MANPPFIYTNPAAGQQAVQYAQLQAQQDQDREHRINDMYRLASQQATDLTKGSQQAAISRNNMLNQNNQRDLDRQLQDRGYASAQTVAGIAAGPRDDAIKARQAADAAANKAFALDNFNRGTSFALTLNDPKTPLSLKQKLMQSGDVEMGPDGVWRSRHPNPNPTESITDIRQRVIGIPGSMGVGGNIPAAMDTMPSRARMLQMGPPSYPSAPAGSSGPNSPIQWNNFPSYPGNFRVPVQNPAPVPRQSDLITPPQDVPVDQPGYYDNQPVY
jgi:hypothetical protein